MKDYMGRKKIYITSEQKQNAKRKDNELYYEKHKDEIKRKRMDKYWKTKNMDKKLSLL